MKLNDIIASRALLEELAKMDMNGAAALKFAEFLKVAFTAIQEFETKRAELFHKFGEEAGEGEEKRLQIIPENEKKFNTAIKRGLNKEVDVDPIDIASLGINISAAKIINAGGLFK